MAYSTILSLLKWTIILGLLVTLIQYWLLTKSYVFSEEAVAKIAKKHIGKTLVFQHTIHCCLVFVAFDQEEEVLFCTDNSPTYDCLH